MSSLRLQPESDLTVEEEETTGSVLHTNRPPDMENLIPEGKTGKEASSKT